MIPNNVEVIISDWKTDNKGIYGLSVVNDFH